MALLLVRLHHIAEYMAMFIMKFANPTTCCLLYFVSQWKAFDFFEVSQVKPGDDETRAFFENNEISSVCSGSDSLLLGSDDGHARIVGPSWKVIRSFHAHETGRITHMRQVEGTSLLVTVSVCMHFALRFFRESKNVLLCVMAEEDC